MLFLIFLSDIAYVVSFLFKKDFLVLAIFFLPLINMSLILIFLPLLIVKIRSLELVVVVSFKIL